MKTPSSNNQTQNIVIPETLFKTPYNFDHDDHSRSNGIIHSGESRARQEFKEECDINTIVRNFGVTGSLPVSVIAPQYGDFDTVNDYHTAANMIANSNQNFLNLPAAIRARFNHDPQELLEFCSNEANRSEAESLGLVFKRNSVFEGDKSPEKAE